MNTFKNFLKKHPKTAVILPVIISIVLGLGIIKIKIKDDVVEMLPKNLPARIALTELEETFGASDFIGITIGQKDKSVFNYTTLEKLKRITEKLEEVPFIETVKSLSNISMMKGTEYGLEVFPIMETVPSTPNGLKELEDLIFDEGEYVGSFVSEDKQYLSIYILLAYYHTDSPVVYNTVKEIVASEIGPEEIHINGVPVIAGIIGKAIRKDLMILIPLVILVLIFILYVGLRNMQGVLLTLLIIILSVLPAIGLMGYFNVPFMVINSAMPVILLALSCAYSIHVIMKFYSALAHKKTRTKTVIHTIDELFLPITATSLTTIVGFLSLVTSPLPVLFEFGIFVSVGILWAWVLSLTMLPGLLILLPVPKKIKKIIKNIPKQRGFFNKASDLFSNLTIKHKIISILVYTIITLVSIFGITKLRVESSIDRFFDKKSEVRLANRIMNEHFGGSANLSIIIKGDIQEPIILNKMLALQKYLKKTKGVGATASIANIICSINKAINDNDPGFKKIPKTKKAVSQALLLYSMSGDPENLEMLVNSDYNAAHLNIRITSMYSKDVKKIVKKINDYFPKYFPKDVSYSITGSSIFTKELSELTAISSIKSIIFSLIAVFIIGVFLYRSVPFGLLNIIPLSITMIIIYGFMGFAGIDFSIEIAIICSIIIGVGIDYALHYTAKYCLVANKMTQEETARTVVSNIGPPILSNATSISLGFLVLTTSVLIPLRSLGLLVSISMILAAVTTLTMLSSILNMIKPEIKHKILIFEEETEK